MARLLVALLFGLFALASAAPRPSCQEGDGAVVGAVGGTPVTEIEFARYLARKYRSEKLGKNLIGDARDRILVETEAARKKIEVTPEEIDREFESLDRRVKKETAGKQTLRSYLDRKGASVEEFKTYVRRLLAVRKLIRLEKNLAADANVSDDEVRKWLGERAEAAKVIVDPGRLPEGVVLKVGEHEVDEIRFGRLVNGTLSLRDRAQELDQHLKQRFIEMELAKAGLTLNASQIDAAIARERQRYANDPNTRGLKYEAILAQLGTSIEERRRAPGFRAGASVWMIARKRFTDEDLEKYYLANPDRFGPSVRVRHIVVRVKAEGSPFSPGVDEAEARKKIEALRKRILGGEKFEKVARLASDDRTRFQGGDLGFIHRAGKMDPTFSAAAFALEVGEVSEPVRTRFGFHLIQVTEKKPAAPFAEELGHVLRERAREWLRKELAATRIENSYLERLEKEAAGTASKPDGKSR